MEPLFWAAFLYRKDTEFRKEFIKEITLHSPGLCGSACYTPAQRIINFTLWTSASFPTKKLP